MLVLSRINRELKERYSQGDVTVLSLSGLPHEHKTTLSYICVLAFEGVKQNKVVFSQEELAFLKLSLNLRSLGVLQIVNSFGKIAGQTSYYCYFIHLSIQELLAAYHISHLREVEQEKVFEDLIDEPRFSAVLQFYAAFTTFTNQGVQGIVTRIDLANKKHILLTIMRCCFEAQIEDQSFFQKIIQRLNFRLCIEYVALTHFDCMSVGYFLAFALRAGELESVRLADCSIDDHSLDLLLGELSRHAEACPSGDHDVLQGVTELNISGNNIGDRGIARLATVLQANTTMKKLEIACNSGIAVNGARSLGRALEKVNSSLEELDISRTSIGDEGLAHIANALQTNTCTMKVLIAEYCGILCKGAESIAGALAASRSLEKLYIRGDRLADEFDNAALSLASALTKNTSMKVMRLSWTSTHPDTTLEKMADCIKKSSLIKLELNIFTPQALGEPQVNLEEARERWLKYVEVGGEQLIRSLEDSCLKSFSLTHLNSSAHDLTQICTSLEGAAASVNSKRKEKSKHKVEFSINVATVK